jgi:hypothetical protein
VKKEPSLFDFLNDITHNKSGLFENGQTRNYSVFMVNRGLGQHLDTILLANEMNKRPNMSDQMHYDFLFHSVDAKRRYGKWAKSDEDNKDLIEFLQHEYQIGKEVALDYLKVIGKDTVQQMKYELQDTGGIQK